MAYEARLIIFSHSCRMGVNLGNISCTSDAYKQHALRASLQTYIWENSLTFRLPGFEPSNRPLEVAKLVSRIMCQLYYTKLMSEGASI